MSLARLLEQATPDAEPDPGFVARDAAQDALAALAPDMARLLIDMAAWMAERYPEAADDPSRLHSRPASLLARFAALDGQAKDNNMNAIETLREFRPDAFHATGELNRATYDAALAKLETLLQAAERVVAPFALDRVSYEDYEALAAAVRDAEGEA